MRWDGLGWDGIGWNACQVCVAQTLSSDSRRAASSFPTVLRTAGADTGDLSLLPRLGTGAGTYTSPAWPHGVFPTPGQPWMHVMVGPRGPHSCRGGGGSCDVLGMSTHLCTSSWWDEGGQLRGISQAHLLHCHHLLWWHPSSVCPERVYKEAMGSKICGAGKSMLLK